MQTRPVHAQPVHSEDGSTRRPATGRRLPRRRTRPLSLTLLVVAAFALLGGVPAAQATQGQPAITGQINTETGATSFDLSGCSSGCNGVEGSTNADGYTGVVGYYDGATSGVAGGVYGDGGNGWGVFGRTFSDQRAGVRGSNLSGGNGVYGTSSGSGASGVYGDNTAGGYGVAGRAGGSHPGVLGENTGAGPGVEADTPGNFASAVFAHHDGTNPGFGVWGQAAAGQGVVGIGGASVGDGVEGKATATGRSGVWAHHVGSNSGYGVTATASVGSGVYASGSSYGVIGSTSSANGAGVYASNGLGGYGLRVNGKAGFSRSGLLTLGSSASSVTKTGVPLTSASYVLATLQTNIVGLFIQGAVPNPAGSSITIYFSKTAPIGTRVAWFVVN